MKRYRKDIIRYMKDYRKIKKRTAKEQDNNNKMIYRRSIDNERIIKYIFK
jgi:hypothetical protein